MKATNLVALLLFVLLIPFAFSSLLNYNVSEFTQPFPLQVLRSYNNRFELVQNWQISTCLSSPCVIEPEEIFTIQGYWLVSPDGNPVVDCYREPFNSSMISDLNLELDGDLERLWPSLYIPNVYEYWEDQWNEYGGCTRLRQDSYFRLAYVLRTVFDFLDYLENDGKSPILPGDYALVDDIIEAIEAGISKVVGREVNNVVQIQCEEAEGEYVLNQIFLCLAGGVPAECPARTMCVGMALIPKKNRPPSPPPPIWSPPPPPQRSPPPPPRRSPPPPPRRPPPPSPGRLPPPPPRRSPPPPPRRSPPPPPRRSPPPPPRRSPPPPPRRSPPPPPRRSPPPPPRRSPPPPPRRSPPPPPRRSPPPPPRRSPPPPRRSPPPPRRPPSPRQPFFAGMVAAINSSLLQAY